MQLRRVFPVIQLFVLTALALLFAGSITPAHGQDVNFKFDTTFLEHHRTGLYRYDDPDYADVLVRRTRRRQIEYTKAGKESTKIVLTIAWKDASEYWLTFVRHKNHPGCLRPGYVIKCKIIYADAEKYTCLWQCKECGRGKTTFIKLK